MQHQQQHDIAARSAQACLHKVRWCTVHGHWTEMDNTSSEAVRQYRHQNFSDWQVTATVDFITEQKAN
jgi:hypothetical protein